LQRRVIQFEWLGLLLVLRFLQLSWYVLHEWLMAFFYLLIFSLRNQPLKDGGVVFVYGFYSWGVINFGQGLGLKGDGGMIGRRCFVMLCSKKGLLEKVVDYGVSILRE